jgi:hypothetical protein
MLHVTHIDVEFFIHKSEKEEESKSIKSRNNKTRMKFKEYQAVDGKERSWEMRSNGKY